MRGEGGGRGRVATRRRQSLNLPISQSPISISNHPSPPPVTLPNAKGVGAGGAGRLRPRRLPVIERDVLYRHRDAAQTHARRQGDDGGRRLYAGAGQRPRQAAVTSRDLVKGETGKREPRSSETAACFVAPPAPSLPISQSPNLNSNLPSADVEVIAVRACAKSSPNACCSRYRRRRNSRSTPRPMRGPTEMLRKRPRGNPKRWGLRRDHDQRPGALCRGAHAAGFRA